MTPPPAIVLVGGLGTRLRALHPDLPKALAPVRGRPFIEHLLGWLRGHGVERIHLAAGYRAEQLAAWRAAQPADPLLTVAIEPAPRGTGGGLRFAAGHLAEAAEYLVLNGDSFLPNLDLAAWLGHALTPDTWADLAITRIEKAGRYGTVEFDAGQRLTAFLEKAERPAGWVNGGVYRMRRELLGRIPADAPCSLETEVFPALAREGLLAVHPVPEPLLDMGTPEGLAATEQFLATA